MTVTINNLQDVYKSKLIDVETMELRGYKLVKELFVDSSGFGMDGEEALTQSQFIKELTDLLKEHDSLYATITNQGQFQVYVGLFKKTGKKISKKIGNNTYEVNYGDKTAIRLHNTNVITFAGEKIILDSGGWKTRTTADRMSKYLPQGYVYRKNWELYANYKGVDYKFNGNTLILDR